MKTTSIIPFLRLLYFSLPINRTARSCHMWVNSLPPFTLTPHLLLSLPTSSSSSSSPTPAHTPQPPSLSRPLERTVLEVTVCKGQRWHVLPANRKSGGSLFADQWQPFVFLWKIQPDNRRIRGRGVCWKKHSNFCTDKCFCRFVWLNFSSFVSLLCVFRILLCFFLFHEK